VQRRTVLKANFLSTIYKRVDGEEETLPPQNLLRCDEGQGIYLSQIVSCKPNRKGQPDNRHLSSLKIEQRAGFCKNGVSPCGVQGDVLWYDGVLGVP